MKRFFDHILAYYDSPLPIGSDEINKRLQMWLNNTHCGHKEVQKFPSSMRVLPSICLQERGIPINCRLVLLRPALHLIDLHTT